MTDIMKLMPTDLKLLTEFIEYYSEHSRWSTAFTLLISITVASLIAFLGSFIELQDSNSLFHNQEPEWMTVNIQADSMKFITSKQNAIPLKIVSANDSDILIKNTHSDTLKYKIIERNTENKIYFPITMEISKKDSLKKDSLTIKSKTTDTIIPLKNLLSTVALMDSTSISLISVKNENNKEVGIEQIKFSYFTKREGHNLRFSAFQFLSLCTTFLGFIFTIFFYNLRRNVEIRIQELNKEVEERHQNPKFILERLKQVSNDISHLLEKEKQEIKEQEIDKEKKEEKLKEVLIKYEKIIDLKDVLNEKQEEKNQSPAFISELLEQILKDISPLFSSFKEQEEQEIEKQEKDDEKKKERLQEVHRKYYVLSKSIKDLKETIKNYKKPQNT